MMRVLIIKTSSMGDVIHALPAISDMASNIPGIQIDWVVEKSFAAMPAQHWGVNRVIPLQWRKWRKSLSSADTRSAVHAWRQQMAQDRYDLIIDLQGLLKSALFACFAIGPRAGYDWHSIREPIASLFYRHRGHVSRRLHAVDRCRQLCAQLLNYPLPTTPPDFGLKTNSEAWTPGLGKFAVLVPCASRPEKLWPEANWVQVGRQLKERGWNIAVMWGSSEEELLAKHIANAVDAQVPPFLTVSQVADTLAQAELIVGLDTGMSHIAAAHGRPTVGIYCDHEPGLAGLIGSGLVASLGGKGQPPSIADVQEKISTLISNTSRNLQPPPHS